MGMVVEREEWVLTPLAYPLISAASLAAVLLLPHFSRPHAAVVTPSSPSPFDVGTTPFLRFRRAFLLLFCLASVAEGIQSVFGEDEFVRCGFGREQMAARLAAATAAALFLGGASGVVSDKLGPQNACIFYWMLQLAVGGLKSFSGLRCAWVNNFILALASSMFCFCFETWIVLEHEKVCVCIDIFCCYFCLHQWCPSFNHFMPNFQQGQKQDSLFDTFWLMTFFESISLVGSQGITNLLLDDDNKGILLPYTFAALVSIIGILYIRKAPSISTAHHASVIGSYQKSFFAHVLRDKRVLILVLAQASVQFSVSAFWFLWAPTIVADGRDAPLSLIYPCFLVSRMLGSAAVPWFYGAMAPFQNEDSLTTAYIAAGLALSVVAYDYQEIGTLVILFCIFHASMGFILPLLARFRTMYLPNELRGGMMSFSLALGNAPMFIFLIQAPTMGTSQIQPF
ncbi:unnamed protein product [Triticum turgidum subsp. durum]|uniref:Molybdate-anion transporter n=1 Tax=Triticum turgidum subsp. durum TaxID=4567 RepID=A0A9R0ZE96_TRITD|nr:unnamed protein product [Triticum turgidum subsp. durum]